MTEPEGRRRPGPVPTPAAERVLRRVEVVETGYGTPCWLWQGCVSRRGYGVVASRVDDRYRFEGVHRAVHAARYGPIPDGFEVDHLCSVLTCVRHTEAVTTLENHRRQQLRNLPTIPDWITPEERYIFHHVPSHDPEAAASPLAPIPKKLAPWREPQRPTVPPPMTYDEMLHQREATCDDVVVPAPTRLEVNMAKRTIESLIDDLDGSEASQTIEFAYKGKAYRLDLNDTNAAELEEALAPYIAAAQNMAVDGGTTRRTRSGGPRVASSGLSVGDYDPKEVRAWAQANNVEVSPRGRVSAKVVEQFRAANA